MIFATPDASAQLDQLNDVLEDIRDVLFGIAALMSWVITGAGLYLLHKHGILEKIFHG